MNTANRQAHEKLILIGKVGDDSFVPWITRHAGKLGLIAHISSVGTDRIEVDMAGPPDLLDAMEVGCSLGPINVWIEDIQRIPLAPIVPKE